MKSILSICILLFVSLTACSSSETSTNINTATKSKKSTIQTQSVNGVYKYSDSSVKSTVNVSSKSWTGKLVIVTGFGDSYDNSNASYSNGIVTNGKLYDSSGYVQIGSVNGRSLSFSSGALAGVSHRK